MLGVYVFESWEVAVVVVVVRDELFVRKCTRGMPMSYSRRHRPLVAQTLWPLGLYDELWYPEKRAEALTSDSRRRTSELDRTASLRKDRIT